MASQTFALSGAGTTASSTVTLAAGYALMADFWVRDHAALFA